VRVGEPSTTKGRTPLRENLRLVLPAAAAAVALVAIAALGLFLRAGTPVASVQLDPVDAREEYWGVAEIHPRPLGNQLVKLRLNNLDEPEPGSFYQMWFVSGGSASAPGRSPRNPKGPRSGSPYRPRLGATARC
jgi:hypothetical protein